MHAWKRSTLARLAAITDEGSVHPRDQVTDLAVMLRDVGEVMLRAERALGQALEALEVKQGRPVADEPPPHCSTTAARQELDIDRMEVMRLVWLGRLDKREFARLLRRVRAAKPGRHPSVRALHEWMGGKK